MEINDTEDRDNRSDERPLSTYWAHLDTEDIGREMVTRADQFFDYLEALGLVESWRKYVSAYHGRDVNSSYNVRGIESLGDSGQFKYVNENQFRSFLRTMHNTVTINPPAFDCRSVNTDASANQLAALGTTILDYYVKKKRLDLKLNVAVEQALTMDAGYCLVEWDLNEGREYGQVGAEYDGDLLITNPTQLDVVYDPSVTDWSRLPWVIVRQTLPRVQLLEQYPEAHDAIMKAPRAHDSDSSRRWIVYEPSLFRDLSDDVEVLKLFHKRTLYSNGGRYVVSLRTGEVLFDSPLPYDAIPLHRLVMAEHSGALHGHCPARELMALQEGLNSITSAMLTNFAAFGIQYVTVPHDADLDTSYLDTGGLTLIKCQPGQEPKALNLTQIPQVSFQLREAFIAAMAEVSGVSEVSRGRTAKAGEAGAAMALQASMTAQNIGPFTADYYRFAGEVATTMLHMLRTFGQNPRTLSILGKSASGKTTFVGTKDLANFDRVICELGNPSSHTFVGRQNMATEMAQRGLINAEQYIEILSTGNIANAFEPVREEMNYVRQENEWMMDGRQPMVLRTDNHAAHIAVHTQILNNADFRLAGDDPQKVQVMQLVMAHIQEHEAMLQQEQAAMMPQMAPQGAAPQGAQQGGGGGDEGGAPTTDQLGLTPAAAPAVGQAEAAGTSLPRMPRAPTPGQ